MKTSIKKKTNKNVRNFSSANPLFAQKQAITTAMLEYLGISAFILMMVTIVVAMKCFEQEPPFNPMSLFIVMLILGGYFIYNGVLFFRRFKVFLEYRKIQFANEQVVSLICKKVSLLIHPVSKHTSVVLGVVLVDESGNKFYYVYPEKDAPSDFGKKCIKEQYIGNIELVCYRDTCVVKRLPPLK